MGIAVFSGMLGVTVFGLMLTPLFYVLVRKLSWSRAIKGTPGIAVDAHAQPSFSDNTG
jgi:hypothetical protein